MDGVLRPLPTEKGSIDFYIPMEKVRPFNLAGHSDGFLRLGRLGARLSSQLEALKNQAAASRRRGRRSNVRQERLELL